MPTESICIDCAFPGTCRNDGHGFLCVSGPSSILHAFHTNKGEVALALVFWPEGFVPRMTLMVLRDRSECSKLWEGRGGGAFGVGFFAGRFCATDDVDAFLVVGRVEMMGGEGGAFGTTSLNQSLDMSPKLSPT